MHIKINFSNQSGSKVLVLCGAVMLFSFGHSGCGAKDTKLVSGLRAKSETLNVSKGRAILSSNTSNSSARDSNPIEALNARIDDLATQISKVSLVQNGNVVIHKGLSHEENKRMADHVNQTQALTQEKPTPPNPGPDLREGVNTKNRLEAIRDRLRNDAQGNEELKQQKPPISPSQGRDSRKGLNKENRLEAIRDRLRNEMEN